jgi:hypothetical protein
MIYFIGKIGVKMVRRGDMPSKNLENKGDIEIYEIRNRGTS